MQTKEEKVKTEAKHKGKTGKMGEKGNTNSNNIKKKREIASND